ncbi:MAG: tetratricopeptide repeat protein [Deltaproteobacteria bacterium]|nr:tetratricopeptide repeat protein [Deltaproteobacteria bacterium]
MIHQGRSRRAWQVAWAWLLLAGFPLGGCAKQLSSVLPSFSPPSEDEEIRISREFRREAKKHLQFVGDPEVERYLDRMGRQILASMGPQSFDYRFFIVRDPQLNAFAVPGGSVFFYTGLIERAKSSAEIAGVLGHEIVHIKSRHMARMSGFDAVSLLSMVGAILLARTGAGAHAAGMVGQAVSAQRHIAYGRQLEMEADTLGVRYMAAAGYDPKGSLAFLKTMEQERALNPVNIPTYLMSHPVTQERVANVELVIRTLPKSDVKPVPHDPLRKIQAIIRIDQREDAAVLADYEKQMRQNPENGEARHLLGFVQMLKNQLPEAQQNLEAARRLKADDPELQRDLGRLYTQTGDLATARKALEKAGELDPKEPLTYLYRGELSEKEGDLRAAAGAYLNAHNLAPLWDKPHYRLSIVYGKLDRLGDAHYHLGRSFLLQDEDEKAIADFERAVKYFGENSPRGQLIRDEIKTLRARPR